MFYIHFIPDRADRYQSEQYTQEWTGSLCLVILAQIKAELMRLVV